MTLPEAPRDGIVAMVRASAGGQPLKTVKKAKSTNNAKKA